MSNYSKLLQHSLLSKDETYDLVIEYQATTDTLVKQRIEGIIIKYNFKYLYKMSAGFYHKYHTSSIVDLDDCINIACLSVRKALTKFDVAKGFCFSTYLTPWVFSALQRAYQKAQRTVRLPVHILENTRIIKKYINNFELTHNRYPSLSEISEHLGLSIEKIETCLLNSKSIVSLNILTFNEDNNSSELLDIISDHEQYSPDEYLNSQLQTETINTLLSVLNDRDREIIKMRYGINPENKVYTLGAIGDIFNISRERCRQVITSSIRKLKQSKEINQLKQFI